MANKTLKQLYAQFERIYNGAFHTAKHFKAECIFDHYERNIRNFLNIPSIPWYDMDARSNEELKNHIELLENTPVSREIYMR